MTAMKFHPVLAWGCLLAVSATAVAQEETPLTLRQAIGQALVQGFDMELQEYDLDSAKEGVAGAKGVFNPLVSLNAGKIVDRNAAHDGLPGSSSEGISTDVGVSQRLTTGADVGISTNLNRSAIDPVVAALNPVYASGLRLTLRQPLLRGFGKTVNTAAIRGAQIGLENAQRDYLASALTVIESTEIAYYQLAGAREQLSVVQASLELAKRLQQEAQTKQRIGMATRLDVLQGETGVANAQLSVLRAENTVKSAQDALLALIGRFDFDRPLVPAALEERLPDVVPQMQTSYELALRQQPELLNARAALDLAELDVAVAKNDLKLGLDLSVGLGLNGDDVGARDAFSDTFGSERSTWQAGLSLTYPLGRTGEKARYRQSKNRLKQQQLGLQQQEQVVLVGVRNAVRDVATNVESVKIAAQSVTLSEKQYELENARFKSGLSTSRRVLEAQQDLESARVALVQAKINLQTALAALRRIEGSSLDYYGLTLHGP